jgi:biotin operon repressor
MAKMSAKNRMLTVLMKEEGKNTFTVSQARQRFGIANVSARIDELRKDGYNIITNTKTNREGKRINYYSL